MPTEYVNDSLCHYFSCWQGTCNENHSTPPDDSFILLIWVNTMSLAYQLAKCGDMGECLSPKSSCLVIFGSFHSGFGVDNINPQTPIDSRASEIFILLVENEVVPCVLFEDKWVKFFANQPSPFSLWFISSFFGPSHWEFCYFWNSLRSVHICVCSWLIFWLENSLVRPQGSPLCILHDFVS